MRRFAIATCLLVLTAEFSGCQDKAENLSERQARLVASQNIELKQELLQKNEEIQVLQSQLDECQGKVEAMKQQSVAAAGNMMEMIKASTQKLAEENVALQEKVKELEAQLAEKRTE